MEKDSDSNSGSAKTHSATQNSVSTIPGWLTPSAFCFSIVFLLSILVLSVTIPSPTPFQYTIFRIIISLGGAAFSIAITGFLSIRLNLPAGGYIIGGGALAVFVTLYFFSPTIPGVLKPVPLVDQRGHLLNSPAGPAAL